MNRKLIISDIKNNKGESLSLTFFFLVSAFAFALTFLLFSILIGSIDTLMNKAMTPDYLQMHSGEIEEDRLYDFAKENGYIKDFQICRFLNINNSNISIDDKSLSNSTQDNGLCVQSERFDYLINMDNEIASVNPSEVYVPICYKNLYNVSPGSEMKIGNYTLKVAGFVRDSQMNSMMASSKRFLVNSEDYEKIKEIGSEEYLIEFILNEAKDVNKLQADYVDRNLPMNGPSVTHSLIKLMNALSDGILAMIVLLISVIVLVISLICIKFILLTGLERSKKEIGLLKALGTSKGNIRRVYESKFVILSVIGTLTGLIMATVVSDPLLSSTKELYGECENKALPLIGTVIAVAVTQVICLLSVRKYVKKLEKFSATEVLYKENLFGKNKKTKYIIFSIITAMTLFIMILPDNVLTTVSNPDFVTYMGIGGADLRIDIRQCSDITKKATDVYEEINKEDINSVLLMTKQETVTVNNEKAVMCIEYGNHEVFPVSYIDGRAPVSENEIAVSLINSEDLSLSIGDKITLLQNEEGSNKDNLELTVTGIYSDITNGGKTAKRYCSDVSALSDNVQWAIIYISTGCNVNDVSENNELTDIEKAVSEVEGVQVTDISNYVLGTYGQTISSVKKASEASKIIGAVVLFSVTALFLRLLAGQEKMQLSLKKALGVSSIQVKKEFIKKVANYPFAGIILGVILGCFLSEKAVAIALSGLGAAGLKIIINPLMTFIVSPLIAVIVLIISAIPSIKEIDKITAYECVTGKD